LDGGVNRRDAVAVAEGGEGFSPSEELLVVLVMRVERAAVKFVAAGKKAGVEDRRIYDGCAQLFERVGESEGFRRVV
jgi:hypothetical protein